MVVENVQRRFNLNNFETQNVEGTGQDENPRRAYLKAELDALRKIEQTMIRIFNVRQQHNIANEFDGITYSVIITEIQGIEAELTK